MLSVPSVYDFRKVTAGMGKGQLPKICEAKAVSGKTNNIRFTVANAECYLNYDKLTRGICFE